MIPILRGVAKSWLLLISNATYVDFPEMGSINIKDLKATRSHHRHLKKK